MSETLEDNEIIHVRRAESTDAQEIDALATRETLAVFGQFNGVSIM